MDNRDDGLQPGIIKLDQDEQAASTNSEVVFDSSEFTGKNDGPESLVPGSDKDKKKSSIIPLITKWQTWAIASGVILVGAAVAILLIVVSYNAKINDLSNVSKYDSALNSYTLLETSYEDKINELAEVAFSSNYTSSSVSKGIFSKNSIYPTKKQIDQASMKCLTQYGASAEDIDYAKKRIPGSELVNEGKSISEAYDTIERASAAYRSATEAIDSCREMLLEPIKADFDIELGEIITSTVELDYKKYDQLVKITYKGKRKLGNLTVTYGNYDASGVLINYRKATFSNYNEPLENGGMIELNLYGSNAYMTPNSDIISRIKTTKIVAIAGTYVSE